ncbi:pyruvate kinase [Rhizobium sp. TH135]|jgi:pyruvate kinase|uniref:pyruvate kinase n=1 Tax=Rhizobium sp. TH135 TaxID=2067451 RepID=UPI000C7A4047|nr:pyruvate kinase [Rhizobium sp. TH135]PLK71574.1 pyruvate kinase [Rhizobium sp. TH135]
MRDKTDASTRAAEIHAEMMALRQAILTEAAQSVTAGQTDDLAIANLGHYLALRRHDIRSLQRRLMALGLSSMGRLEGRVLPTIDAVLSALSCLAKTTEKTPAMPLEADFFAGEARLEAESLALFGATPAGRRTRIMVTLPSQAADGPDLTLDLARAGMDVARINCAHDGPEAWRAMTAFVRDAAAIVGRDIKVLMDIAGPKIRTGAVASVEKKARLQAGDRVRLVASGAPRVDERISFSAAVSLPEMVTRLSVGDRLRYDDGKLEAVVESLAEGEAVILIRRTKSGGTKLKPEKGINLPDTALGLSPLTAKDETDLVTVIECADLIGYSFVSRPEDIDLLDTVLARHGLQDRPLGLIAKIEQPLALTNLPELMARARRRGPFGVMIARGDLAAEIGFERLAEMQEEILWICEAASVPCIWATQVLEDMVKEGIPTRGEMTDAAMAARAECVMLNKGPAVVEAVSLLDRLMGRMNDHMFKKTPTLRALKSW